MKKYSVSILRILMMGVVLASLVFNPQYSVSAAPILTIDPITWNVIGLDSNDVTDGPNNFPVGVRVCNTGDTPATNVTATFVWDSANGNINLRPGSLNPINLATLNNGDCSDFYFEVQITRTAAAYDTVRQFHINVTADTLGTISTPTPREIYVERLVSQNRNSVLDVLLDGVSIAAGGTMDLIVGNTYTITLVSATAPNGYEQLETFINFPNTIFQIESVATTYTANAGTDPDAGTKLYADGCGWIDDPTDPDYHTNASCSGVGKYGGTVTVNYVVTIISGGGTSQPLNTLIYDFSGSSYHYNSDFAVSTRIANILDPAAISIAKDGVIDQTIVPPTDETNVGDRINYTIVITNTGGVPLTGITLTDSQADSLTCVPSLAGLTLQPGESVTCTGFHTLTQDDFDAGSVTNLATADSDQVGPVSDSTTQTLPQNPALTLEKSADISTYTTVGQVVNYTYTLTNTGNVTLTAPYAVDDNLVTVDCSGAASPLLPGESTTCTATYTITQADIDAGSVTNIATATATFGTTDVTSNEDTVTINYAALNIIKEVSTDNVNWNDTSVNVNVGDTVYYRIRVENTGNVTLTGFTVDDGMAGCTLTREADNPGDDDADFEPGETWVYTCSVVAVAGTQDNTATADSNETGQDSDDASYFGANPALSVVKSETTTGPYSVGETINYNIVVTNTGNITLTGVTVVDNSAVVGVCTPTQPSTLAPGESMTCPASHVVTQTDIDNGSYSNTATGDSNETPPGEDTVTVIFPQNPALSVVKSETSTGPYAIGDTITYDIVVTNVGNVTLTGVTATDNSAVVGACTPAQPSTLAPGASMTCPASHVVTLADVNNGSYSNTATGDSNETPPGEDTVTVTFSANPALSIVKSEASTGPYGVGDTITYSIVVTNTGDVTLTGVTVTDNAAALGTCTPTQPATLDPGASMTCPASHVVTQDDINSGSFSNTATADSNETPPGEDTVTVTFEQAPAISIVKSSDATGTNAVGDTITYTYEVENTGDVTLTNVTVTDGHTGLSAITCVPAQGSTLAPGDQMTCTATYTVTQADVDAGQIDNTGVVTGTPPTGPDVTDNDPLSEPVAQGPQLGIVKSQTSNGPYGVGDTINYSIVVTNTGNVTLTGVTVTDNSAVVGVCTPSQPATLAPGASMTCAASHVVTSDDLTNGSYVNTATADSNETPPSDDTVTIDFGIADLSLVKTASNTSPDVLTNINFTITVTNSGPDDATGVEVGEILPGGFTLVSASPSQGSYNTTTGIWLIGDLDLNQTVTLTMVVRVNQSGPYTNTAEIVESLQIDPDSIPNNGIESEDDQDSVTITPNNPPPPPPPPTPGPPVTTSGFLIPVTGFAPGMVTDLSNVPNSAYSDTSITLDIPTLSMEVPIVGVPKAEGTWNVSWLGNQAGWLEGSAFPSWNGNSVLTSHVYLSNGKPGPFAKLHELKTGDQVVVHAFGQQYIFEVLTNATMSPTDRSVMRHEERPWLTLVTCADYDFETGTYRNRFIVRAVLVKVTADK